jgi:GAF domain-containing protein
VLSGVSQLVERHVPRALASSGILESDGVIRHRTAPSLPPDIVRLLDETQPDSDLGRLLRRPGTREVIWEDIARDELWAGDGRDCVLAAGLASCWSLNVHDPGTGELLGCLVVFHPEARPPTVDERDLLDRCRHLAAIAINHARVEARLEHLALHDTTASATPRATACSRRWRAASPVPCAPTTPWAGSVATSSSCCARTSTARPALSRWPNGSQPRSSHRCRSGTRTS